MTEVTSLAVAAFRISNPPLSSAERSATRKALMEGKELLRREGVSTPTLKMLVWRLIQDASDTLARIPDNERRFQLSGERSSWPEYRHLAIERYIAEVSQLNDPKMSREDSLSPLPRIGITDPTAEARMYVVLGWFRFVRGRTASRIKRDKLVVLALAQGQQLRSVRRFMGRDTSDAAIYSIKTKVVTQIAEAIRGEFDAIR